MCTGILLWGTAPGLYNQSLGFNIGFQYQVQYLVQYWGWISGSILVFNIWFNIGVDYWVEYWVEYWVQYLVQYWVQYRVQYLVKYWCMMHDARCTMYHALPMKFIVEVNQANLAWSFRQRLKWRDTHSEWHCWVSIKVLNGEHRKRRTGASLMNYQAWKCKIVQQNKNILSFCCVYYSKGLE